MRLRCPLLIMCGILLVTVSITTPRQTQGQSTDTQLTKNVTMRLSLRLDALYARMVAIYQRLSTRTDIATSAASRAQRTRVTRLLRQRNDLSLQLSQLSPHIATVVASLNLLSPESTRSDYLAVRVKLIELEGKMAQILSGQKSMLTQLRQIAPVPKASVSATKVGSR